MIRDDIVVNIGIETDSFEYAPFAQKGGLGKVHQVFDDKLNAIIEELNDTLAHECCDGESPYPGYPRACAIEGSRLMAEQYRIVVEVDRRLSAVREIEAQINANLKRAERLSQVVLRHPFSEMLGVKSFGDSKAKESA